MQSRCAGLSLACTIKHMLMKYEPSSWTATTASVCRHNCEQRRHLCDASRTASILSLVPLTRVEIRTIEGSGHVFGALVFDSTFLFPVFGARLCRHFTSHIGNTVASSAVPSSPDLRWRQAFSKVFGCCTSALNSSRNQWLQQGSRRKPL